MTIQQEHSSLRTMWAVILGGAAAGLVDQLSAFATFIPRGASAIGILQYLASGVIGSRAFAGGIPAAILGLAVHFSLTTAMAGAFVFAARRMAFLLRWPWVSGLCYGILLCLFMDYVAVPLSAVSNWTPPAGWNLIGALLAHCFYVGLPIAFLARAFLGQGVTDTAGAEPQGDTRREPMGRRILIKKQLGARKRRDDLRLSSWNDCCATHR